MKRTIICITAAVGLLVSGATSGFAQDGERVRLRDLPDPVQKTIRAQQRGEDIKRIERFTHEGKTVYQVQIDRDRNSKVFVSESGSLITGESATALRNRGTASASADSRLGELPKNVQQTFKREAGSARITEIDKDTVRGRTVYEIEFTRNGQEDELSIHEDGTIARERLSRDDRDDRRDSARERDADRASAGFDRPLAATRKVEFESLPAAVKQTVREEAGSNRIEDAERGRLDDRVVYEIAFKKDGEHNELRVAEDGSIVQRVAGTNIRFPGALSVGEVPAPVRRAIESEVGSGEVNDIDKKTVEGKTVYEVGFKKQKGGAQQEIQIAEDGTVIGEPAGAESRDSDD